MAAVNTYKGCSDDPMCFFIFYPFDVPLGRLGDLQQIGILLSLPRYLYLDTLPRSSTGSTYLWTGAVNLHRGWNVVRQYAPRASQLYS